ncbi:MAG: response regulator [Pseudomonadales bacterium]|nr:response regulator [Pseudomonadales bacterium]
MPQDTMLQDTMLQETMSLLRQQFLGLNRVLSTVMELISNGLMFDDDEALLKYAAKLLVSKHSFCMCAIHLVTPQKLRLASAISEAAIIDPSISSEADSVWVIACEHLAQQLLDQKSDKLIKRRASDSIYYAVPIIYRDETLAILTVNAKTVDDNHPQLLSIFGRILTSVLINTRQNQNLAQAVLQRTEQLEAAWKIADQSSRAKSQFLTNMSHEYLTPLNTIVGSCALITETDLTGTQREYTNAIVASSEKLQSMVNELLDYSQSESGTLAIQILPTHLPNLLQTLHDEFVPQADLKGLKFELLQSTDLPETVAIDSQRVSQILRNLISNSIKFTQAGSITLDVYAENPSLKKAAFKKAEFNENEQYPPTIHFSVIDTGIGIEKPDLASIFEAFHQVDGSPTRSYQGVGLGLATSQSMARLLGAEIQATSTPGMGSRFNLALPVPDLVIDEPLRTSELVPSTISFKQDDANQYPSTLCVDVLLVEDNIINQKLAARLLEKLGCKVDIANDGIEAVEKFSQSSYDLIFMDCQMPRMDGFEATSNIRQLEGEKHTPIVALTANSLPADRARSYRAGMDEFLTKPILKETLRQAILKWAVH